MSKYNFTTIKQKNN